MIKKYLMFIVCLCTVNVFELAQQFKNSNPAFKKPQLVEERTSLETEQLWKKRLSMLLDAENKLMKVIRFRKITGIFTVASMAMFLFSLYIAPTMSPVFFYGLIVVAAFGMATYPAWLLASKSNKKQRDDISRLFYKSNHEIYFSVNHVYCCLGTTLKKAGSKQAFRRVDFEYVHVAAQLTRAQRADSFVWISSVGADAKSSNFYLRVKGELVN